MKIEISLTRALAKKLNLVLKPTINKEPSIHHFYADIFTRGHQSSAFLFNTFMGYTAVALTKELRKNFPLATKDALRRALMTDEVKPYLIDAYLADIEDVELSLTNNPKSTASCNHMKIEFSFFYDRYTEVPPLGYLHHHERWNHRICKRPLSKDQDDYIYPDDEMLGYLLDCYYDETIEAKDRMAYEATKVVYADPSLPPNDLSHFSRQELDSYLGPLFSDDRILPSHSIEWFYKNHPNPSMEDLFEFIRKEDTDWAHRRMDVPLLRAFALDFQVYQEYKARFHPQRVYQKFLERTGLKP